MERDFEGQMKVAKQYKRIPKELLPHISESFKRFKNGDYDRFKSVDDVLKQGKRKGAYIVSAFWDGKHYGGIFIYNKEKANVKRTFKPGRKIWSTMGDEKVCDLCRQLDAQIREADEPFVAYWPNGTKVELQAPPAHYITKGPKKGTPTCRCAVMHFEQIQFPEED
jgi:hypothetical protein